MKRAATNQQERIINLYQSVRFYLIALQILTFGVQYHGLCNTPE